MSRIINPENSGTERNRLVRAVAIALRELAEQKDINPLTEDLAAFIVLALHEISRTVETTVQPWEKRGYWLKADKFRMNWSWSENLASQIEEAINIGDWESVAIHAATISAKLNDVQVSKTHRMGEPWRGAYDRLRNRESPLTNGEET